METYVQLPNESGAALRLLTEPQLGGGGVLASTRRCLPAIF